MCKIGCFGLLVGFVVIVGLFLVVQSWGGVGFVLCILMVEVLQGILFVGVVIVFEKVGVILLVNCFWLFVWFFGLGDLIKVGEYCVLLCFSQFDILKLLQGGKMFQCFVVVLEGYLLVMVYDVLMKVDGLIGSVGVFVEGLVLFDSYVFQCGNMCVLVVVWMQIVMKVYFVVVWVKCKFGIVVMMFEQVIIFVLIVEKEIGKLFECCIVVVVYGNCLKCGMLLQVDLIVIYLIIKGCLLGWCILCFELQVKNGYNIYVEMGLLVGLIVNLGCVLIDVVFDLVQLNVLYFVVDGMGGYVFVIMLEQYNVNVQKWYVIWKVCGEM